MTQARTNETARIAMAAMSADAICVAYAKAAPMPRTTTNIRAGNDLFLFISIPSFQWLDPEIV
jgi:hypothetical protein